MKSIKLGLIAAALTSVFLSTQATAQTDPIIKPCLSGWTYQKSGTAGDYVCYKMEKRPQCKKGNIPGKIYQPKTARFSRFTASQVRIEYFCSVQN